MSKVNSSWMNFSEVDAQAVRDAERVRQFMDDMPSFKDFDQNDQCEDIEFIEYVVDAIVKGEFNLSWDYPGGVRGFYEDHKSLFPSDFVLRDY